MDNLTVKAWMLPWPSPTVRLVALALARRARDTGACWAKQATIADDTGLSPKSVQRALAEMEGMDPPRIRRVERRRTDGGRSSDMIWLTFPAVTLDADTVSAKPIRTLDDFDAEDAIAASAHPMDSVSGGGVTGSPGAPVGESEQKESLKESEGKTPSAAPTVSDEEIDALYRMVRPLCSETGKQRTKPRDFRAAVRRALNEGASLEALVKGLRAYLQTDLATRERGIHQAGLQVVINDGRALELGLEVLAEEEALDRAALATGDGALDDVGTLEEPGPARQRFWMETWSRSGMWPAERGPQPGHVGCRVSLELLTEFGVLASAVPGPGAHAEQGARPTLAAPRYPDGLPPTIPWPDEGAAPTDDDDAGAFA